jgi:hypothetical protein
VAVGTGVRVAVGVAVSVTKFVAVLVKAKVGISADRVSVAEFSGNTVACCDCPQAVRQTRPIQNKKRHFGFINPPFEGQLKRASHNALLSDLWS